LVMAGWSFLFIHIGKTSLQDQKHQEEKGKQHTIIIKKRLKSDKEIVTRG